MSHRSVSSSDICLSVLSIFLQLELFTYYKSLWSQQNVVNKACVHNTKNNYFVIKMCLYCWQFSQTFAIFKSSRMGEFFQVITTTNTHQVQNLISVFSNLFWSKYGLELNNVITEPQSQMVNDVSETFKVKDYLFCYKHLYF